MVPIHCSVVLNVNLTGSSNSNVPHSAPTRTVQVFGGNLVFTLVMALGKPYYWLSAANQLESFNEIC